jgi:hypothetical protein
VQIGYKFEINPYDLCVASKIVDGAQMTVSRHVNDVKVSRINSMHVDPFLEWIKKIYGTNGDVKTN